MGEFEVPANLVDSALRDPHPDRREWISTLPTAVAGLVERWSLRVGRPFQPGGTSAWVAPVRDSTGRDLVLKVAWWHPEALHEAAGLEAWGGNGAVVLHAAQTFDQTSALLLERCVPGTTLNLVATEQQQDVVVTGLLRRLWLEPAPGHPFRALQTMCTQWADAFDDKLTAAPAMVDPGLARAGMELFRGLPATAESTRLLCTDLHAENVLVAQREPWLVIDPKPYVGDPTYDPLQHMLNCEHRLHTDPLGVCPAAG